MWSRETLIPGLYSTEWYNGKKIKEGWLANNEDYLVGVPRIRLLRVQEGKNFTLPEPFDQPQLLTIQAIAKIPNSQKIRCFIVLTKFSMFYRVGTTYGRNIFSQIISKFNLLRLIVRYIRHHENKRTRDGKSKTKREQYTKEKDFKL